MRAVFADTDYWIALLNRRDRLHESAVHFCSELSSTLVVTSEMVLTEVLNHFSDGPGNTRTVIGVGEAKRNRPSLPEPASIGFRFASPTLQLA